MQKLRAVKHRTFCILLAAGWVLCLAGPAGARQEVLYDLPLPGPDGPFYTVQVHVLSMRENAEARTEALRRQGYPAYIADVTTSDGKTLCKIRIGKYASEARAREVAAHFSRASGREALLVRSDADEAQRGPAGIAETEPVPRAAQAAAPSRPTGAAPHSPGAPAQGVAAPASPDRPVGTYYTVQVSTVTSEATARAQVRALIARGQAAYVVDVSVGAGTSLYKVRMGRYPDEAAASQAAREYEKQGHPPCLVVRSTKPLPIPGPVSSVPAERPAAGPAGEAAGDAGPLVIFSKSAVQTGSAYYTVQVSTETDRAAAVKHARALAGQGHGSYVVAMNRQLYKVRMGCYAVEAAARRAARAYEGQGHPACLVVRSRIAVPGLSATGAAPSPAQATPETPVAASSAGSEAGLQEWPATVSKIYAYRWPENELNLTNDFANIPDHLQDRIEYISVYPVRYLGPGAQAGEFFFEIEQKKHAVTLPGLLLSSARAYELACAYLREQVNGVPVRIKYPPSSVSGQAVLQGRLYTRAGDCINVDMIRAGAGKVNPASVPNGQQEEFLQAEHEAQLAGHGVWDRAARP